MLLIIAVNPWPRTLYYWYTKPFLGYFACFLWVWEPRCIQNWQLVKKIIILSLRPFTVVYCFFIAPRSTKSPRSNRSDSPVLQPAQQDDLFSTVGLESPRQKEKKTEAFSSLAIAGLFVRPIKLGFSFSSDNEWKFIACVFAKTFCYLYF